MTEFLCIAILADKTGPAPSPGQAWPVRGVEILNAQLRPGEPPAEVNIPVSFVQRHLGSGWLTVTNPRQVERPSQPSPIYDPETGSAQVAPAHLGAKTPPHSFRHFDTICLDTVSHGLLTYRVVAQPDKYVEDADFDEPVTINHYASGNTRVDTFYRCALEA